MSPHFGRLYMVYTDEAVLGNNDTDIMLRFSDDNGGTWSSPPIRVNDDPAAPVRSQFLPRIAVNRLSGDIAVTWHDARNSPTNTSMQEFCTIATPTGTSPLFMANGQVGDGLSTGTGGSPPTPGTVDIQFGDYSGMTYFQGLVHPIWADNSNSTGDNPDGATKFDAYTDRVSGGPAANEGDPHLTTVNGVHYDFQSAGEFVSLRDADGLEIQTRQTPISTTFNPGPDPHDGLATCVSLNTAVAARVGTHRVTYEPNVNGVPDPSGLQLRVDGSLVSLGTNGVDLGGGGRMAKGPSGVGIEVDFADGTALMAIPNWWASQSKWYLNVDVYHTPALEGLLGAIARGNWLPALPDGKSMGPMPSAMHQRYVDLYQRFADAWRVTDKTSLFDYAPGTSAKTFVLENWPHETPPCVVPGTIPAEPASARVAQLACGPITDKAAKRNCVFDVMITGNTGFAKTYLLSQRIKVGSTTTTLSNDKDSTRYGEPVAFTATVARMASGRMGVTTGTVQFIVDGSKASDQIRVNARGQGTWRTRSLKIGEHRVAAIYAPIPTSRLLGGSSPDGRHTVRE